MYRTLTSNVLSADRPSEYSEQLLRRLGLEERLDKDPEVVLAAAPATILECGRSATSISGSRAGSSARCRTTTSGKTLFR